MICSIQGNQRERRVGLEHQGGGMPCFIRCRIDDLMIGMAVDANRAFLIFLPGQAMSAFVLPVFEQDLVAGATHFGRILVRRRCPAFPDLHDAMIAVAVAAARSIDQTGQ